MNSNDDDKNETWPIIKKKSETVNGEKKNTKLFVNVIGLQKILSSKKKSSLLSSVLCFTFKVCD